MLARKGFRCGGPAEVLWIDNWVDLDRGWQVDVECVSFLCKDLERAHPLIVKLLAWTACVPVLC
ncbi:uncharacterized protein ASPGLDRAFT_654754 [Aspergillus glaucus CBS 516.65]|uniref:Uncharacterized protein n=1 Tax=Aspergillus glaucus CBS 516.65 TaxID=1160497 RepID=A0A1L9VBI7_ASPGL|nr:hypothetical protein ASPGLDRAFT_654754 [Aspergillus glaucus CBS 516.65]OJJ81298.1 hypothetical protein ASPGLDRAFT_654754 [Aspergillus glaucus CBS 516.65]